MNRRLKQKTEDFDKLYREHKQTEADYKRRGAEFDRQQDRLKELLKEARADLTQKMDELEKKTEALAEEKTKAVETARLLEEAEKEKPKLNKQWFEEAERAKLVLNNLQTTYQHQVIGYESQAATVVAIIVRLKSEKQEAEERAKLGVDRIR